MLSLMHAAMSMLTAATTMPAGCPGTAAEAEALLKNAADTAGLGEMKRLTGRYEPVTIERLGAISKNAVRLQSGQATRHLWKVQFNLDGALADFSAPFLAAHSARAKFKVDCDDRRCSWRPADANDLNEDRIDKLVPAGGLYMAGIHPSKNEPGRILLDCTYRGS